MIVRAHWSSTVFISGYTFNSLVQKIRVEEVREDRVFFQFFSLEKTFFKVSEGNIRHNFKWYH